jgi:hypothetical protein
MKTNREYLSWSQYNLWQTSKKQFYKRYVLGEKSPTSKYMTKGTEFGHYMETGEILPSVNNPDMLEVVGSSIDKLEIMEHEIKTTISDERLGDIKLLAYIDSGMNNFEYFIEYKTGKHPWTQERVNLHEQLDFYALCYYLKSDLKVIPSCKLVWVETQEDNEGNLYFTGNFEEFEREFTEEGLAMMLVKVIMVMHEIAEYEYKEMELDNDIVKRYVGINDKINALKEESDILRLQIMTQMSNAQVKYAESNYGSFSISERKSYSYPRKITELKEKYNDEIKQLQEEAKKSGEARIIVSESLRFNKKK